ncbi:MAG: PilZ domain-containing protein [Candidatus Omnitrophica bacterium]|nr:PilZ domain-containing protein [Candidatus Omnitrophota bacterium]
MLIEKRKYKRVSVSFSAEYRGKNIWQGAETNNISEGGMFLSTEKVESSETAAELIFNFDEEGQEIIYIKGKVIWNREIPVVNNQGKAMPAGMGIQFIKFFSSECREFIAGKINNWKE